MTCTPNLVQIMMFPKDGTMSQFMEMASESLGIKAKRAFLAVGDNPEVGFYVLIRLKLGFKLEISCSLVFRPTVIPWRFYATYNTTQIEAPNNFSPDDTVIVTEGGDPTEDTASTSSISPPETVELEANYRWHLMATHFPNHTYHTYDFHTR